MSSNIIFDIDTILADIVDVRLQGRSLPTHTTIDLMDCSERLTRLRSGLERAHKILESVKDCVFN